MISSADSRILLCDGTEDPPLVVLECVEPLIPVTVHVEVWDREPPARPGADRLWTGPRVQPLRSRRGSVSVRPGGQEATVRTIPLPSGPGEYLVGLWHTGREVMAARVPAVRRLRGELDELDWEQYVDELAGTEEYLLRIWRPAPA
ncbi:hypothetical protein JOF53_000074 [Crossiella equi]|uniref:Uncharacterized protein n=1 Tax=Crossiella equi TaxID=130796 RepID=A0ABS5A3P4_9PSEU|nr:hypothetical protein [Crossiella equi]MBP2471202.1 hypothetical protein [Crossiella equi]